MPKSRPSRTPRQSLVTDESETTDEPVLFPQPIPKSAFVSVNKTPGNIPPSSIDHNPASISSESLPVNQSVPINQDLSSPCEAPKEEDPADREPSPEVSDQPVTGPGQITLGRKTVFEMESILESMDVDDLLEAIDEEGESKASGTKQSQPSRREESLEGALDNDLEEVVGNMLQMESIQPTQSTEEIPCVVLFDFEARSPEEVTVHEGEFVTAIQDGEQWVKIRTIDGREGFVPFAFIQILGGQGRQVRAIYDYSEPGDDRLQLRVGDVITLIQEAEGWFEGYNERGENGWFPQSYVEML